VVEVAAAVIQRPDGSFLLAQRPAGKVYAGWWEFPGGKVEAGEPAAAALARELHEELGIDVVRAYPWISRRHVYEHATVNLHFFRVTAWKGEPHPKENQDFVWQRLDEPMATPMLPANAPVLASLALPVEYAVTDSARFGLDAIERRMKAGLKLLQIREPMLDPESRIAFTTRVIELASRYRCKVLTKSHFLGADGVHLSASDLLHTRERPQGDLVAASCHTREELDHAMRLGLDFVVLGPVKDKAPALGWEGFARLARGASIPVYAIGGMTRADLEPAWAAGAHGVAMIRGAWG
jgi:8-oxo-dGTP diphosphatase